jgi:hypothetical protein
MIEGSRENTMDGETQATRADGAAPFHEPQHLRPNGDNAGRNDPTDGLRTKANTATVETLVERYSHPRLGETGHRLTPA